MSENKFTFGEKAVGLSFNPSNDDTVYKIKKHYADLIDLLNSLRENELLIGKAGGVINQEKVRMYSVAITEAQTSQMWAVKAETWK